MIFLAWAIIAVAYLAALPWGLCALFVSPNDPPAKWWVPIAGWTLLNAAAAAICGAAYAVWWAIHYIAGGTP